MKAMILAAGLGTRMRPLTDNLPKPLIPVAGRPLIEYHLDRCRAAGIKEVVINVSYLGHLIESHLGSGEPWGLQITYSREPEPLDVVGGLRQALPLLGGQPFWCLSADVFTQFSLTDVSPEVLKQDGADYLGHFILVPNPPHHPRGDFGLANDVAVGPSPLTETAPLYTYAGMAFLSPQIVVDCASDATQNKLAPMVRAAIAQGKVQAEVYSGLWSDVGTPERLAALSQQLDQA